eukprot:scaffold51278_cov58-Phaeocystis_antarctica.AAC.4
MLRSAPAAYFATWAAPCAASSESRATALRRTACSAHLCGGQARATVRAKARTGCGGLGHRFCSAAQASSTVASSSRQPKSTWSAPAAISAFLVSAESTSTESEHRLPMTQSTWFRVGMSSSDRSAASGTITPLARSRWPMSLPASPYDTETISIRIPRPSARSSALGEPKRFSCITTNSSSGKLISSAMASLVVGR